MSAGFRHICGGSRLIVTGNDTRFWFVRGRLTAHRAPIASVDDLFTDVCTL